MSLHEEPRRFGIVSALSLSREMAWVIEELKIFIFVLIFFGATASAQRPDCIDLLLRRTLRQNVEASLWRVQKSLRDLGFESRIVKYERIDGGEKVRVIEMTKFSDQVLVGRVMARARQRFGARFFIDPLLYRSGEGRAVTEEPGPIVIIDLNEFKGDLNIAPIALLHEIRHLYFSDLLRRSVKDSIYFGDIETYLEDYKLTRGNFYDDEVSMEELSTYYRDLRIALRRYRLGQIGRPEVVRDVQKLRRIAGLIGRQVDAVDLNTNSKDIETRRRRDGHSVRVSYPIYRGRAIEDNVAAHLIMVFVSHNVSSLTRSEILTLARERILLLRYECERMRTFAEEILKTI